MSATIENIRRAPQPLPLRDRRAHRLREVCALIGISRATLWRRHKAGQVKFTYIGATPFVTDQHLAELLGEHSAA